MEDRNNQSYDLPNLLKHRVLDIYGIAVKNKYMTAGDYYERLERFVDETPKVIERLGTPETTVREAMVFKTFDGLEGYRDLLADIGCRGLTRDFELVLSAGKNGGCKPDGLCLTQLINGLGELHKRIKSARRTNAAGTTDAPAKNTRGLPLKFVLDLLSSEEDTRKLRILAVDDSGLMLRVITAALSEQYEVYALTKGSLVEGFLAHTTPELFLLDVVMPDMSGHDIVRVIKKFDEHKDTPIIFMTASVTPDHVAEAFALTECDFITKPVNTEQLLNMVQKRIVRKKAWLYEG